MNIDMMKFAKCINAIIEHDSVAYAVFIQFFCHNSVRISCTAVDLTNGDMMTLAICISTTVEYDSVAYAIFIQFSCHNSVFDFMYQRLL